MQFLRSFAQLQHVAQNRDGVAASPQPLQGLERLPHRGRIGVVGVDDQKGAVSELPDLGPPRDRAEGGKARRDFMAVEAERPCGGGGGEGVYDVVFPGGGQENRERRFRR